MNKMMLALVAISAGVFLSGNAFANVGDGDLGSPNTTNMNINGSVGGVCHLEADDVNFPVFHAGDGENSADVDATGSATVACSPGQAFTISLGRGDDPGGTTDPVMRSMHQTYADVSGAGTEADPEVTTFTPVPEGFNLQYELYSDSDRTVVWGDDDLPTASQTYPGDGKDDLGEGLAVQIEHTIFGRIPDNPHNLGAVPGLYRDTVVVTLTFEAPATTTPTPPSS